jgi:pimeloyl-ACP methyl ester carboxylesterase
MNIKQEGVGVQGDQTKFAQYGHLATRLLELLRDGLHGPMKEEEQPETDEDHIIGRYIYINAPVWGRTKVFYESAGDGPQQIVFLHTAGSDSRQYHGVMNDERMRQKCTMIAFDLPAHGRSFPGSNYIPGNHTNNEDAYVGTIAAMIKALKLDKPIVCGASMAGQVSVACAIRADEVGCGGTIPLQGCDYLTMDRAFHDKSPIVNQALWNPDWIWGMMVRLYSLTRLHLPSQHESSKLIHSLSAPKPPTSTNSSSGTCTPAKPTASFTATSTSTSAASTPATASRPSTALNALFTF